MNNTSGSDNVPVLTSYDTLMFMLINNLLDISQQSCPSLGVKCLVLRKRGDE